MRSLDTMSDAIAISSPNGRMSKRSKEAFLKILRERLFPPGEDIFSNVRDPKPPAQRLREQAARLRELADRGMSTKKFNREADRLEREAAALAV